MNSYGFISAKYLRSHAIKKSLAASFWLLADFFEGIGFAL